MKIIILISIALLLGVFIFYHYTNDTQVPTTTVESKNIKKHNINVVDFQDMSSSIKKNGVEIISSETFTPYFLDATRNINIYFGCIAKSSAKKLIHVYLPACTIQAPVTLKYNTSSIFENKKLKDHFLIVQKQYRQDSILYYSERTRRIKQFSFEVDALINTYKNKLSGQTDLSTAILVAERVFNYPDKDSTRSYLLINSDGKDTYGKCIKKFNATAEVVLINASGLTHTSIDKILTLKLESTEQAVQYTLRN